jgi:hypothetical protein
MLIQKIEIKTPIRKTSPRIKRYLNQSSSSCQLSPNNDNNNINKLPFLFNDTKIKKDSIKYVMVLPQLLLK